MRAGRHHNNKGTRQIKRGRCEAQVKSAAQRLGIPYYRERSMKPDNSNLGPCARYGFGKVGPGWKQILVDLDKKLIEIASAGGDDTKVEAVQIKEKFGGLRVYLDHGAFDKEAGEQLWEAMEEAEKRSLEVCEACGSEEGVETRPMAGRRFSRTLTLCAKHHRKRDKEGTLTFGGHTV